MTDFFDDEHDLEYVRGRYGDVADQELLFEEIRRHVDEAMAEDAERPYTVRPEARGDWAARPESVGEAVRRVVADLDRLHGPRRSGKPPAPLFQRHKRDEANVREPPDDSPAHAEAKAAYMEADTRAKAYYGIRRAHFIEHGVTNGARHPHELPFEAKALDDRVRSTEADLLRNWQIENDLRMWAMDPESTIRKKAARFGRPREESLQFAPEGFVPWRVKGAKPPKARR